MMSSYSFCMEENNAYRNHFRYPRNAAAKNNLSMEEYKESVEIIDVMKPIYNIKASN